MEESKTATWLALVGILGYIIFDKTGKLNQSQIMNIAIDQHSEVLESFNSNCGSKVSVKITTVKLDTIDENIIRFKPDGHHFPTEFEESIMLLHSKGHADYD